MILVMNARNGAVTTYDVPNATDVAEFGGVIYFFTTDGVFKLAASDTAQVNIEVTSGDMDHKALEMKSYDNVVVDADTQDQLYVTVGGYTYEAVNYGPDDANYVARPGRGIRFKRDSVSVTNSGGHVVINKIDVGIAKSARRV